MNERDDLTRAVLKTSRWLVAGIVAILVILATLVGVYLLAPDQVRSSKWQRAISDSERAVPSTGCRRVLYRTRKFRGNALGKATRVKRPGSRPECVIELDARYWPAGLLRCVLVHERLHLAGRKHSRNPRSIMYPALSSRHPLCRRRLPPGRTAAGLPVTTPPSSPGSKPTPAVAALPTAAEPSGAVIFTGDFETGSFSQWDSTQQVGGGQAAVVSSPVAQGRYAARFTLPSSGGRAEVYKSGAAGSVGEGDERIYSWATMPMPDALGPAGAFQNILQWKDDTGGPPIAFELEGNQYAIKAGGAFKFVGPANPGQWTRFDVRILFSTSSSRGSIEVRRDGVVVVARYSVATLGDGRNYLKQGYYAGGHGGTVYHDGLTVTAP